MESNIFHIKLSLDNIEVIPNARIMAVDSTSFCADFSLAQMISIARMSGAAALIQGPTGRWYLSSETALVSTEKYITYLLNMGS
jgi:hypothetical protein